MNLATFLAWRETHPPMMGAEDPPAETPAEGEKKPAESEGGIDRLLAGFENFSGAMTSRIEKIEQALQAPEAEPAVEEFEALADPAFTAGDFDPQGQLTQEAANRELQKIIDQRVQEQIRPMQEQQQMARLTVEADALEARYPDLGDPGKQKEWVDKSMEAAAQIGRPELGAEPRFLEMVYLAEKAKEQAAQETPGGAGREVVLEAGGGAAAAAEPEQDDTADRIVKLAQSRRPFAVKAE